MSIITGERQEDLGEDSGASVFGGLVDVGDGRIVQVYISVVETSIAVNRMEVELTWIDNRELTEEEYYEPIEITIGESTFDDILVTYCIREILVLGRQGA